MTPTQFRRIALGMRDVTEKSHMNHPDFRVNGKIFATLGYPDRRHGALMLTPEQQQECLRSNADAFSPAAGAWGRMGSTMVRLDAVDEQTVGQAMTLAWQNAVNKNAGARSRTKHSSKERRTRTEPRTRTRQ